MESLSTLNHHIVLMHDQEVWEKTLRYVVNHLHEPDMDNNMEPYRTQLVNNRKERSKEALYELINPQ
jgi:hypothetical protein